MYQYVLETAQLKSSFAENDMGGPAGHQVDNKPVICPCLKKGTHKANPFLLYSLPLETTAVSWAGEQSGDF